MPTSESPDRVTPPTPSPTRRRRGLTTFIRVLAVLAALIALDVALCLAIEPYGANSEVVWYEYRHEEEPIDTLVIGSSVSQNAMLPEPLEEMLGAHPFSLASPGQCASTALDCLETALKDHDIKRVIMGCSFTYLTEPPWPNSNMAITQARCAGLPLGEKIVEYARLITSPDFVGSAGSIGFLAPFSLNPVPDNLSIPENIQNRLSIATPVEARLKWDDGWEKHDHGFCTHLGLLDASTLRIEKLASYGLEDEDPHPSQVRNLERICELCEERGIELVVFIAPESPAEQLYLGERYVRNLKPVEELVRAHGGLYFDFSMARPDFFRIEPTDLLDGHHLNNEGARRFCPVFASTLARAEQGEDVSSLFYTYDEWGEYCSSLTDIYLVNFDYAANHGQLTLTTSCLTGPQEQIEFAYYLQPSGSEEWQLISDWGSELERTLSLEGHGQAEVRVDARHVGSTDVEQSFHRSVLY